MVENLFANGYSHSQTSMAGNPIGVTTASLILSC